MTSSTPSQRNRVIHWTRASRQSITLHLADQHGNTLCGKSLDTAKMVVQANRLGSPVCLFCKRKIGL